MCNYGFGYYNNIGYGYSNAYANNFLGFTLGYALANQMFGNRGCCMPYNPFMGYNLGYMGCYSAPQLYSYNPYAFSTTSIISYCV